MAAVKELLRAENDGSLSFGDYTLSEKTKKDNYEFEGDIYKVKTFSEITKLERNGMFVYESVPGSAVEGFKETDSEVAFSVSAKGDVQFTLELEPECEYEFKWKTQCQRGTFRRTGSDNESCKMLIY